MMDTIISRAKHGGRQAIAAPRSRGKSEVVKGLQVFLVLAGLSRFLLPVAATTDLASRLYEDFQKKIETNDLLLADFPEVCWPVRQLEGAPQRAKRQHVNGARTEIVWKTGGYLCLAKLPPELIEKEGYGDYGGVKMDFYGMDAAFRGINIDGDRPDFILVDDPETRESAKSNTQIEDREQILDRDIAGLAGEDKEATIVVLTTIQNRFCLSFQVTDRRPGVGKPAYNGLRFGWIMKWPDTVDDPTDEAKLGLWTQYITLRRLDQESGDEHGLTAIQFYLDNREEMDRGCEMITDYFTPRFLEDGTQLNHSTLQVAMDKIANTDLASYRTEYQNDPEEVEQIQETKLTAARVQSRLTELRQGEIPSDTQCRTIGLDLGKYASHWTEIAWSEEDCIGTIPDYGIMETHGLNTESDLKAVEHALVESMEVFADEVVEGKEPLIVLVDSGKYTQAAYEICRRLGDPFYPSKGWEEGRRFRMPARSDTVVPFLECYAKYMPEDLVWLYHVQTEYWKQWAQDRFMTRPFDDRGFRVPGSLALFDTEGDVKRHLSFSHHMVAEYERWIPVDGKELKRDWYVKNRNNHWLDSTALACAGAGSAGIRLIEQTVMEDSDPQSSKESADNPYRRDGRAFLATQR